MGGRAGGEGGALTDGSRLLRRHLEEEGETSRKKGRRERTRAGAEKVGRKGRGEKESVSFKEGSARREGK